MFLRPIFTRRLMGSLKQTLSSPMEATQKLRLSKLTKIVSLTPQESIQLAQLDQYTQALQYLSRNQIDHAERAVKFALFQAEAKHAQSINLQMCLLNRLAILLKVSGKAVELTDNLEKLYLMSLSLKGARSFQTSKHLLNFLISLVSVDLAKAAATFEHAQDNQIRWNANLSLMKAITSVFHWGRSDEGLKLLEDSTAGEGKDAYRFTNNSAWLKYVSCQPSNRPSIVDQVWRELLKSLILRLTNYEIQAISNSPGTKTPTELIQRYAEDPKQVHQLLLAIKDEESITIMTNLVEILFANKRHEQAVVLLQICLAGAAQCEGPEKFGRLLLLMSSLRQTVNLDWETPLLTLLEGRSSFSQAILRQGLNLYSEFAFKEGRFKEAQKYVDQALSLKGGVELEGILLPDYDFSY